jgi:sodium-dependent phosphate transporter
VRLFVLRPVVGGILGFALVYGGSNAVVWYEPIKDFPFVAGIVPVVISWFLSPLLAGLITLVLFVLIRSIVLRRANSTKIAFWVLPFLMVLTFFINLFFILVSHSAAATATAGTTRPGNQQGTHRGVFSDH